jgi:hypothetical protein
MLGFVNSFMSWYLKKRIPLIEYNFEHGVEMQKHVFESLLAKAKIRHLGEILNYPK